MKLRWQAAARATVQLYYEHFATPEQDDKEGINNQMWSIKSEERN